MTASATRLDFVAVGPQKAGTTWLDAMLRQHNGVRLPGKVKETFFFDERFERGENWYWAHFTPARAGALNGEVGPSYFDVPQARERLRRHNPGLKVIVSLRDPVQRAYSLYCHHYGRGRLAGDFGASARAMPRLLESGDYLRHLAGWAADFGPGSIFLVRQEDIQQRPAAVLAAVQEFLGLPPQPASGLDEVFNERVQPRSLGVSRIATAVARTFRLLGLHRAVDALKKSPLLGAVSRGGKDVFPPLGEAHAAALRTRYAAEYRWLEQCRFERGGMRLSECWPPSPAL
ncbi:MAG TPA: sulfotransferase [Solimonas sp.]|nr:sulfotransferase [Solimonas sp.]